MTSLASGRVVGGRFELVRLIGSGGMGEVWLAYDQELEEHVAAKFLPDDATPEQLALLRRECRNARKLAHPGIVPVYDFHRTAEHAFVTMAHVEASSIASLRGRPWREISPALVQLAEALGYAHDRGVVHRDVKAANVLIDDRSNIHVLDFGIAAALGAAGGSEEPRLQGGGSPGAASPEQRAGAKPAPAEDIYALGVLTRDLSSGTTLPAEVDALLTACSNRDPRHRPSSMAELQRTFATDGEASSEAAAAPVQLVPPPRVVKPTAVAPAADGRTSGTLAADAPAAYPRLHPGRRGVGAKTIAAFVVLLSLAAGVFVVLPRWVDTSPSTASGAPGSSDETEGDADSGTTRTPAEPDADVNELEALAPLKAKADALAERAGQARESLEARGVGSWGDGSYRSALSAIAAAEEQHGRREFDAAAASYETALGAFEELEATAASVVSDALARGRRALASGSATEARDAFALALKIQPGHSEATSGIARSAVLDELRSLVARAHAREQAGDLSGAASGYREAIALDPRSESAQAGLARVDAQASAAAFREAMTEAVSALNEKDFDRAQESFERAAAIRPGAADAAEGLSAVSEGRKLQSIAQHRRRAEQLEAGESWRDAEKEYQSVLAIDPTIRFARDGKARSGRRAEIAEALDYHIGNPQRLSDAAVLEQARGAVDRARGVSTEPRAQLEQKVARLDALVSEYSTPVQVYLLSDNATEVVVYKIGNIGTFDRHELVLRPGTYTVVGRRPGYRDVRHRLVVRANVVPEPLWVKCEEQI